MTKSTNLPAVKSLFGMPVHVGRWGFVLVGMIMNICMGTVYAWSVFRGPISKHFSQGDVQITAMQTLWPFMLFLGLFTVFMPISGKLVQKYSPRMLSIVGSVLVGAGWILSSYATSMEFLYITYGVIAGIGVGIVYGLPIAVVARWFPDRKGLAVGVTVLGFGVSALVTAPIAQSLIQSEGVLQSFHTLGFAFLAALIALSMTLKFPPAGWQPANWKGASAAASQRNYTPAEMAKTPAGLGLWLCFIIGSVAGLMAIGIASNVGQEIVKLDAATATALVSLFAVFNGGGRPIFGWLTDKLRPAKAAALSLLLVLLASAAMLMFAGEGTVAVYVVCFCAFWMGLGSWLAIAPTSTLTFFGPKNYAPNYGWMFSGYGVGAIVAGLIAGNAKDV
ncbi:MAG: OFA family MFS transporter, partial [Alphaproteobacteria bacterium]|nr:OFA family MFS transporter [Alphaproteobacteria bacterium]